MAVATYFNPTSTTPTPTSLLFRSAKNRPLPTWLPLPTTVTPLHDLKSNEPDLFTSPLSIGNPSPTSTPFLLDLPSCLPSRFQQSIVLPQISARSYCKLLSDTSRSLWRSSATSGDPQTAASPDLDADPTPIPFNRLPLVICTSWGDDDPSVFLVTIVSTLQGEFQITNGYGTDKATPILMEHWRSFIVEDDFKFISNNGLNTVRIPVGWWIASDPSPPWPYVGGSLQALDNAFVWAEKYALKVIINLHAAPGSQNGNEHSSTRDGSQDWGTTDENIDKTVAVIDFLAARYAKRRGLLAVELINEPRAPGVTLDKLEKYYRAGYAAVRKYTSDAYVIMSNRLSASNTELLQFASGFQGSVVDVHYYNLFSSIFDSMTVQQNIDYVNVNRTAELNSVMLPNGPLVLVGEWVAEWQVRGASKEDYQRFAKAQLDLFGRGTFGWAYWTYRNVQDHWSMEWMIKNGYISL